MKTILVALILSSLTLPAEPIRLSTENPHHFIYEGKTTVLVTSGEHYGALINLDFDYVAYLAALRSHGLNYTRIFGGPYVEFSGFFGYPINQPLSPAPGRFVCPWARSEAPGYINGGNKFDLYSWSQEYYDRLHGFMQCARTNGVIVEFTLFCHYYDDLLWSYSPLHPLNNIQSIPADRLTALTTNSALLPVQQHYIENIATELSQYDNLFYEVCNEPFFGVPESWQSWVISVISSTETNAARKHLIAQNSYSPGGNLLNFHYANGNDINYSSGVPVGNDETDGFQPVLAARQQGWDFMMAGGSLHNNLDLSFTTATPEGSGALRGQMGVLKKFMDGPTMIPNNAVANGLPAGSRVMASINYAAYVKSGSQANLSFSLPLGLYRATWIDPATGNTNKLETFNHGGGNLLVSSPAYSQDVAMKLINTWTLAVPTNQPPATNYPPGVVTNGLAAWFKTAGLNAGALSSWLDSSGTGHHATQNTAASQPLVLNGRVRFDGVNDFMTFNLPVNGLSGMSIFLVAGNNVNQSAGPTQAENAALFWNETTSWGTVYVSPWQTTVALRFGTTQANNRVIYSRPTTVGNSLTLTCGIKNGATDSWYVNGSLIVNQAGKLPAITGCTATGNIGRGYNDSTFYNGDIVEIMIYNRALNDFERQSIEAYLAGKYP